MAHWKVIETRSNLVTVERQGSAGMVSMAPSALGLTIGHDIALGTSVYGSEGAFSLDPSPLPQADPGDEGDHHGG